MADFHLKSMGQAWDRLGQIRSRLIVEKMGQMGQTGTDPKRGCVPQKQASDLRIVENGTDGTDKTAFSKYLIKYIKIVINKARVTRKRGIKNVYKFFAHVSRPMCPTNKCTIQSLENSAVIA